MLLTVIRYVQHRCFGAAVKLLKRNSPDASESILKKSSDSANSADDLKRISELKTLRSLRPCVDADLALRVDGRLENAELPSDAIHRLILPSRHAFTKLIILHEHLEAEHASSSYTLAKTRQRFWIINGISSVKYFFSHCSVCARNRAAPVRQIMADLTVCHVTACNKPF